MTFALYTNSLSAHQLPLAREIVKLVGADNFRYIYTGGNLQGGAQEVNVSESWIQKQVKGKGEGEEKNNSTVHLHRSPSPFQKDDPTTVHLHLSPSPNDWLESADVLLVGGLRPIDLLERRSAKGLRTFYQSERWFKPIPVDFRIPPFTFTSHLHLLLPGCLRLLVPSYRRMAKRFLRLMNGDSNFITLPIGPWAKKDFLRLGARPDKLLDWGYFVEEGSGDKVKVKGEQRKFASSIVGEAPEKPNPIKVLYVGRLLKLKHVDTIIRAVALANKKNNSAVHLHLSPSPNPPPSPSQKEDPTAVHLHLSPSPKKYTLTIVGDGPEKPYLQKLANSIVHLHLSPSPNITFLPPVPLSEVRPLMRQHDILVFASDATDGWGAVVSEALSEGVRVFGTYETGSSVLLPKTDLFHCGDYDTLFEMLLDYRIGPSSVPYDYTPRGAAERLLGKCVL